MKFGIVYFNILKSNLNLKFKGWWRKSWRWRRCWEDLWCRCELFFTQTTKSRNQMILFNNILNIKIVSDGVEHSVEFSWSNSTVHLILDNGDCLPSIQDCQLQVPHRCSVFHGALEWLALALLDVFIFVNHFIKIRRFFLFCWNIFVILKWYNIPYSYGNLNISLFCFAGLSSTWESPVHEFQWSTTGWRTLLWQGPAAGPGSWAQGCQGDTASWWQFCWLSAWPAGVREWWQPAVDQSGYTSRWRAVPGTTHHYQCSQENKKCTRTKFYFFNNYLCFLII